eukprot:306803_1
MGFSLRELEDGNFYEILSISNKASPKEIKKAYRKLALTVHPDKNKDNPDAAKIFTRVFEIKEILLDETKRKEYDSKLRVRAERVRREEKKGAGRRDLKRKLVQREKEAEMSRRAQHLRQKTESERTKKLVEEEIKRMRQEILREEQQKLREKLLADQRKRKEKSKELDLGRIILVKFSGRKESEDDLRVIFEHYGTIEDVIVKESSALISFSDTKAARDAVADPELEDDFGLKVTFSKTSQRRETPSGFSGWDTIRPVGISHEDYEKIVLDRLMHAAKSQNKPDI